SVPATPALRWRGPASGAWKTPTFSVPDEWRIMEVSGLRQGACRFSETPTSTGLRQAFQLRDVSLEYVERALQWFGCGQVDTGTRERGDRGYRAAGSQELQVPFDRTASVVEDVVRQSGGGGYTCGILEGVERNVQVSELRPGHAG